MKDAMRVTYGIATAAMFFVALYAVPVQAACPTAPDPACRLSYGASLTYADADDNAKDKLSFKLTKAVGTIASDFGSPTTTDSYELCVYSAGALVTGMEIGADGDCSDGSCWTMKAKGPAFKDKTGTPDGITAITLAAATDVVDDKAKVGVKGKGAQLGDLGVPLLEPIGIQLHNSLGNCWGANFSGPDQVEQDVVKHKMKLKARASELPACSDTMQNGWESGQDCGGPCGGCGYTQGCYSDSDCVSGTCAAGCNDGVENGDESDIDCGGGCSQKCAFGRTCGSDSDCDSNLCRAGTCSEKLVFVTSTAYAGNFGGLTAADTGCNDRAGIAGLGGSWTAWLSDSSTNAIDRIVDQRYLTRDGVVAFENKAQITNTAKPTLGIGRNEFNGDATGYQAWTGTNNPGGAISPNCLNWTTNNSVERGWVGWPGTPISWSAYGSLTCNNPFHLICFEN